MRDYNVLPVNDVARFWSGVDRTDPNGCWLWLRSLRHGYGQIMFGGKVRLTHRVAWTLLRGKIPRGKFVCHTCDVRHCCNPAHLFIGTQRDNIRDCWQKGRLPLPPIQNGSKNVNAVLSESDIPIIRAKFAAGSSLRQLGREYGIDYTAISSVIRGKTWRHVDGGPHDVTTSRRAQKGSLHRRAVLTETDIPTIRARHAAGISLRQIAKSYGVSGYAIWAITSGRNWRHVN